MSEVYADSFIFFSFSINKQTNEINFLMLLTKKSDRFGISSFNKHSK